MKDGYRNCSGCGPQPIDNFARCNHGRGGLQSLCKSCHRERYRGGRALRRGFPQPHRDWLKKEIGL